MSTFSQQQGCLTQSQIDTLTITSLGSSDVIDLSSINMSGGLTSSYTTDTITITSSCPTPVYSGGAVGSGGSSGYGTITINGGGGSSTFSTLTTSGTVTISPLDVTSLESILGNSEWKHRFPDWDRIQKMCDMYPGLKIAFEKFKTTYYLVKDDYDNPNTKK